MFESLNTFILKTCSFNSFRDVLHDNNEFYNECFSMARIDICDRSNQQSNKKIISISRFKSTFF